MTLQQLKYMITIAEKGSITEAAKELYISQPSLSGAIKDVEKEVKITIFNRCRAGVALTTEGMEFLGYARQVVQQMELLESKYINNLPEKQRFCVSSQHYTFGANAFVELVQQFGQERYEFILNETQTHQVIKDVRNRFSDLGILYLSKNNENVLMKIFEENNLSFYEIFSATPHVFLRREHPLAKKEKIKLEDLKPYPRLSFVQGTYESSNFAEELFSNETAEKSIKISDRAAIVNFMIGLDGYTISSGIFPKYLHGDSIISIPLAEDEIMHIGYILNKDKELSELGKIYIKALKQYQIE
ncbi:MAG: LysR family transcriptional regulator [Schaedlerella sp.]|uniref:LysR family transcriptional regulator n=1 Tax=Schaedlerella sp. TaxID=2676057 RepID=UPI00265E8D2D|nr:LysR family transcriptional regulator [uncultured Schaedlerella sp.]